MYVFEFENIAFFDHFCEIPFIFLVHKFILCGYLKFIQI